MNYSTQIDEWQTDELKDKIDNLKEQLDDKDLEIERLKNIIKELDNYIESDEFNNTFHCCEERNKVKKDIINILKGSDKE